MENNLEDLQKQLEDLKNQSEEHLNGWKRAKADLVNYQKQVEKEKGEWCEFLQANFIKAILPVADSLEAAAQTQNADGFNKIYQQFVAILKQMGIEKIEVLGESPNPEIHEVVGKEKNQEYGAGLICKIVQKGYLLNDKLLRPAKVIVSE
ncbi:MAG: nucleotide exchange factor GrpE [bacterium]|nr:nucleotide exchange factor GrpE [bacterium]